MEWFVNNQPTGSNANFSNPNSINTEITVDQYGTYEIGINGCGNSSIIEVIFETEEPHIIAPDFQNCRRLFGGPSGNKKVDLSMCRGQACSRSLAEELRKLESRECDA